MDRNVYLRRWLRALTLQERRVLGPIAKNRNYFIKQAASEYENHQTIPQHLRMAHEIRLQNILIPHYNAVIPVFGDMVAKRFKSGRVRMELKRMTFVSLMQDWIRKRAKDNSAIIADTDYSDVQDAISTGLTDGLGVAEIASQISDVTGLTAYRAATVARTETHAAATFGAIEEARVTSQEIGIVLEKEWLPTLDDRTRPAHAAMADYGPIPLDDKFNVGGEEMDRPGDPGASAENVINCMHPDTTIQSSGIVAVTRHWYEGLLVVIETESGHKLRVTPNHPILTPAGWRGATFLNKGCRVISRKLTERPLLRDLNVKHVEPTAEKLFDAFSKVGMIVRLDAVNVNFHGDSPDGNVDVVRTEGKLRYSLIAPLLKPIQHFRFACTDFLEGRLLALCLLHFSGSKELFRLVADYFMGIRSQTLALILRGLCHTRIHAFASVSWCDAMVRQAQVNMSALNVEELCQAFYRFSGLKAPDNLARNGRAAASCGYPASCATRSPRNAVRFKNVNDSGVSKPVFNDQRAKSHARLVFADKIIAIYHRPYSGFVYNVETERGYYTGDGIVQHNCRCAIDIREAPAE